MKYMLDTNICIFSIRNSNDNVLKKFHEHLDDELYISSMNLGYEFSGAWMKKISLERLKLSFYMNELLRVSSIDIERGTSYPFARNFSFSIQATF